MCGRSLGSHFEDIKVKSTSFEALPVKKVLFRILHDSCSTMYQGVELSKHKERLNLLQSRYRGYTDEVQKCLGDRVKVQTIDLLTHALTILVTNGWERTESSDFAHQALENVCHFFVDPLENAGVNCSLVQDDMLDHAKSYLNLTGEDYRLIWWKLFNGPNPARWSNIGFYC